MDVILDSNIFLGDPTFRGSQFPEFLQYLKATRSRLIVPTLVRDEVTTSYRRRLLKSINKTREEWEQIRRIVCESYSELPHVDVDREVASLKHRMEHPREGVEAFSLDINCVDVSDVAERGIRRRKPASEAGEELRDVILWLATLHHAKQTGSKTALISSDGHFCESRDTKSLHRELQLESSRRDCQYRSMPV